MYLPKQCDSHSKTCWCVVSVETGQPMEQTRSSSDDFDQDCTEVARLGRLQTKCERGRSKVTQGGQVKPDAYIPQCDGDGNFTPKQCDASTGDCWCIASVTEGNRVLASMSPGHMTFKHDCNRVAKFGRMPTECEIKRDEVAQMMATQSKYSYIQQEMFQPECSLQDGHFLSKQCAKSSCFCVGNRETGEPIPETNIGAYKFDEKFDCQKITAMGRLPTKCENERDNALVANRNMFGRPQAARKMIPECDELAGNFMPKQCPENSGYCFCIMNLQTGTQVAATMTKSDQTFIWDCEFIAMKGRIQSKCELEATEAERMGYSYRPSCTDDGFYTPKQCDDIGCWCVADQREGTRMAETKSKNKLGYELEFDCDIISKLGRMPTKCETEKKRAQDNFEDYIPQCDLVSGRFNAQQCDAGQDICWCVNNLDLGEQVTETIKSKFKVGENDHVNCDIVAKIGRVLTKCETERTMKNRRWWPTCSRTDGNYLPRQCDTQTGYCWCVQSITHGGNIQNTEAKILSKFRKPSNDMMVGNINCAEVASMGRLETFCEQEQKRAVEAEANLQMVGVFMPVCDLDTGLFTAKQCHASTGYCWCVSSAETGTRVEQTITAEMRGEKFEWDCEEILENGFQENVVPEPDLPLIDPEMVDSECFKMAIKARELAELDDTIEPPKCTADGKFESVQIYFGEALCVDSITGEWLREADATMNGWSCEDQTPMVTTTSRPKTKCEIMLFNAKMMMDKGVAQLSLPQCEDDGSFSEMQHDKNKGFYCVESETGNYVSLTYVDEFGVRQCGKPQTKCQKDRDTAKLLVAKGIMSTAVPECDEEGDFERFQEYPTVGLVCVNTDNGAVTNRAELNENGEKVCLRPKTECENHFEEASRMSNSELSLQGRFAKRYVLCLISI